VTFYKIIKFGQTHKYPIPYFFVKGKNMKNRKKNTPLLKFSGSLGE